MRLPDLDLDLLRCFVLVAEARGFTAAGEALGLTQSAVSLRVKRLEEVVPPPAVPSHQPRRLLTREGEMLLAMPRACSR
jgi:DNA-binding transcriptional LysR family regulator